VTGGGWERRVPLVLYLLASLAVHALYVTQISPEILSGELIDTDSYARILRVQDLRETWDWYDATVDRSNAPFGESSHWTRPLDVLLLAGATLAAPAVGFERGLYWAAAFIGPVLQILTGILLAWAVAPLVRGRGLVMIALLAQPAVMVYSLAGRADHHGLILLAFTVLSGYLIRAFVAPGRRRYALLAGAWGGFGLWVSTEFLLPLAAVLAVTALTWLVHGRAYTETNRALTLGWFVATAVALILERPLQHLSSVEYDKLSIVHVVVSGIAAAFWFFAAMAQERRRNRGATLVLGGVLALGVVGLFYPPFFRGPWAEVDPELIRIWLAQVGELRALWPTGSRGWGRFTVYLGLAVIALPGALWLLARERNEAREAAWLFLATALGVFFVAAGFRVRFAAFAEVLAVVFIAGLLDRTFPSRDRALHAKAGPVVRALAAAVVVTGPVVIGALIWSVSDSLPSRATAQAGAMCSVKDMADYLSSESWLAYAPLTIAAHVDFGPELLYCTPHRVLATPYHRNAGVVAAHGLLTSRDLVASQILARARGVDLVLLCPNADQAFFDTTAGDGSLYRRLVEGDPPAWALERRLPPDLARGFMLFSLVP
jgi:hypothetical protein